MVTPEREILELKLRVELEPTSVSALVALGEVYQRSGLDAEADQAFRRVLEFDPQNPHARRGRVYLLRRCYAEAADAYGRAAIVHQVGDLRDPEAAAWLGSLVDSAEPVVCQKVAEALGKSGDRSAVPILIRLLRSEAACAWWQASEALAAIGDRAAVPPLVATLAKGQANARSAAAHALGLLRDSTALEGLLAALAAEDASVRRAAAKALGQLGDASAVPALAHALEDPDPETRAPALEALQALTGLTFRATIFGSARRAARRWWDKTGQRRPWGAGA